MLLNTCFAAVSTSFGEGRTNARYCIACLQLDLGVQLASAWRAPVSLLLLSHLVWLALPSAFKAWSCLLILQVFVRLPCGCCGVTAPHDLSLLVCISKPCSAVLCHAVLCCAVLCCSAGTKDQGVRKAEKDEQYEYQQER